MTECVVDTDVVSFAFKEDTRAELYRPHLEGSILTISFMTVAELHRWGLERNWGIRRQTELTDYLEGYVVYGFDRLLCRKWAEVTDGCRRKGRTIQCADAWIAATALLHGMPLITHNADHFGGVDGLTLVTERDVE